MVNLDRLRALAKDQLLSQKPSPRSPPRGGKREARLRLARACLALCDVVDAASGDLDDMGSELWGPRAYSMLAELARVLEELGL